jgi:hypothetical protein
MSVQSSNTDPATASRAPAIPLYRRLRRVLLVFGLVLWVALLCAWATGAKTKQWSSWLDNFQPKTASTSNKGSKIGRPASGAIGLAYFGEGRADLGKYSVSLFNPLTRTATRADFKLQGTTVCSDESSFRDFLDNNHRYLREQVMVTIRNCDASDLDDPELKLLEKKLVARVNRALGQRFLMAVNFEDFQLSQTSQQAAPAAD